MINLKVESIGVNLPELLSGNEFLDIRQKVQQQKKNMDKFDFLKNVIYQ